MKNALVLALGLFASVNAFAAPKSARLTYLHLDQKAFDLDYNDGYVTVDTTRREAELTLIKKVNCPKGRVCAQVVYPPRTIRLELVSRKTNSCGAVIYTAESDRRMVDGLRETLTIVDNARNHCKTLRALAPVAIAYEQAGMTRTGTFSTYSTFAAEPFVSAVY